MKQLLTILIILTVIHKQEAIGQERKVNDLPVPPNGVWLYDNLFMDLSEISNIHWLEFLHYLKDSSESFKQQCEIDTTVWRQYYFRDYGSHSFRNYLRGISFRFYPVVGLTYEQALLYCEWRSEAVMKNMNKRLRKDSVKITYRLPTEEEWEFAAYGGLDKEEFPYGYEELYGKPIELKEWNEHWRYEPKYLNDERNIALGINRKEFRKAFKEYAKSEQLQFNCKKEYPFDMPDVLRAALGIELGKPNALGIYGMIGNVAEMLQEKGKVKGGSWQHSLEECQIEKSMVVDGVSAWVGFRCIAEVEVYPKHQPIK